MSTPETGLVPLADEDTAGELARLREENRVLREEKARLTRQVGNLRAAARAGYLPSKPQ